MSTLGQIAVQALKPAAALLGPNGQASSLVIGDDGGVFFFPPELLDQVLEYAAESATREEFQLELLLGRRYRFRDVYPLSPELMEEFERTRR